MTTVTGRQTKDAQYFEYSKAANPIAAGLISRVPVETFPSRLHEPNGTSRVVPLDISEQLHIEGPATSPSLCANFVCIRPGDILETHPAATSEVYYVIRGRGRTTFDGHEIDWEEGDFFTLPACGTIWHEAAEDAAFYWVHDAPLLRYLGVAPSAARFEPTLYPREEAIAALREAERDPEAAKRSRVSVLLANRHFEQTRTITHVLWTMFGVLPAAAVQLPHRHESVALDYVIDCERGCYTLIGSDLGDEGEILNPRRVDWERGSAFVTPPGMWHSHHNESAAPGYLIPMQDAGLHTYLRTLDIRFFHPEHESYVSLKP
jgi:gentisate 1,2-dioxygenase